MLCLCSRKAHFEEKKRVTKIQMLLSAGIIALSSIVLCGCQTGVGIGIDVGFVFCDSCHHYHRPYEAGPIVLPPQPPLVVPPHYCPPHHHDCPHRHRRQHYMEPREFRCIKSEPVSALCDMCHTVHVLTLPCPEVRWIYPDNHKTRPVLIPAPRYESQHAVTYGHTHCR